MNIFNVINENYPKMSKGHKKIAEYILRNYDKAAFMTAARLGETVGISESTVVRFASELGFDGYPDLLQSLNEAVRKKLTSVQRIEVAATQLGDEDVLEKVLNFDIERIRATLESCSHEEFAKAVDAIISARKIYIIGSRSAETLARFLSYYLNLMFENVKLLYTMGASELLQQMFHVNENDVVIGVSFPRYSKQTAKALEYASGMSASVIAITDSATSPIAENADCILQAKSDMVSFVDSLVAPLSLINALIVAISIKKRDIVNENFARLESIWDKYDVYEKSDD